MGKRNWARWYSYLCKPIRVASAESCSKSLLSFLSRETTSCSSLFRISVVSFHCHSSMLSIVEAPWSTTRQVGRHLRHFSWIDKAWKYSCQFPIAVFFRCCLFSLRLPDYMKFVRICDTCCRNLTVSTSNNGKQSARIKTVKQNINKTNQTLGQLQIFTVRLLLGSIFVVGVAAVGQTLLVKVR